MKWGLFGAYNNSSGPFNFKYIVPYLKFRGLNKKVTVEQTPYSTLYLGRSLNLLIHPQFLGVRRESSVKN